MPIGRTNPHARPLRRNATDVEAKLWQHLRGRNLDGLKFRRQATVGHYVADFLCAEKRLIIELDGGQHTDDADAGRTAALEALGYRIVRFWNNEVIENLDAVLLTVLEAARSLPSRLKVGSPHPTPARQQAAKPAYPSPVNGRRGWRSPPFSH